MQTRESKNGSVLADECIDLDEVYDFSMNLLGIYLNSDVHFVTTTAGGKEWKGKDDTEQVFLIDKGWKWEQKSYPIFYDLTAMNDVDLPYQQSIKAKNEYQAFYKKLTSEQKSAVAIWGKQTQQINQELHGKTRIKHDPTIVNYWHVVLDGVEFENLQKFDDEKTPPRKKKFIDKKKDPQKFEQAKQQMINLLRTCFIREEDLPDLSQLIKPAYYRKEN